MTIDKYTKFILTLIAVGVIGINFYLFKISIIDKAHALSVKTPILAVTGQTKAYIISNDGSYVCKFQMVAAKLKQWAPTGC